MTGILWRTTVAAHRYLGMAVGALMLMWFATGIVMIYVPYPQLSQAQHLQSLEPIPPGACCAAGAIKLADGEPISSVQVGMLLSTPVARIRPDGRPPFYTAMAGAPIAIAPAKAREIAVSAGPRIAGRGANIRSAVMIDRDQWTVAEDYDFDRPLYRFSFDDARGTQVYVSGNSGAIVLWTTRAERFWNWLGAVPHWLYFTRLRRNGALWSKVLIWTSITGAFLTLLGLYLGVTQFCCGPRLSPYRGWKFWHHLAGLTFGVLTLTWVISGTISMNPWGFLEGGGGNERARLAGEPPPWSAYRTSLTAIGGKAELAGIVTLASAPEAGKLYWVARWPGGKILRLDGDGRTAPVASADLEHAAQVLANGRRIESQGMLRDEDNYYYAKPGSEAVPLPVYRVILADAGHTRYYLDTRTGELRGRIDNSGRGYRWLFDGLHRLDFFGWLRTRPLWDALVLLLLLGGIASTGTGCYLALTRIKRDIRSLMRVMHLRRSGESAMSSRPTPP